MFIQKNNIRNKVINVSRDVSETGKLKLNEEGVFCDEDGKPIDFNEEQAKVLLSIPTNKEYQEASSKAQDVESRDQKSEVGGQTVDENFESTDESESSVPDNDAEDETVNEVEAEKSGIPDKSFKVPQIQEFLRNNNKDFPSNATKAELLELVKEVVEKAE